LNLSRKIQAITLNPSYESVSSSASWLAPKVEPQGNGRQEKLRCWLRPTSVLVVDIGLEESQSLKGPFLHGPSRGGPLATEKKQDAVRIRADIFRPQRGESLRQRKELQQIEKKFKVRARESSLSTTQAPPGQPENVL
jgi:hypothetical protein